MCVFVCVDCVPLYGVFMSVFTRLCVCSVVVLHLCVCR